MKKTITIILIALVAYAAIFMFLRNLKKQQYLKYLHSLGFGVADRMKFKELEDSYNYLYNYARKYASNAAQFVLTNNPALYARLQSIVLKYGALFNLNTAASETNIPNLNLSLGTTIVP